MRRTVVSFAWGALDVARIEHAPDFAPDAGRRQVVFKLRANNPRRPVCSRHLTPHGSVHRPLLLRVRFVHVAQFLPQVKRRRRFVRNVFQFNQRRVFVLVRSRAFVPQNNATDVHSVSLLLFFADKKKTKDVSQSRFYYASLLFMEDDDDDDGTRPKRRRPKREDSRKKNRGREILPGTAPRDRRRAVRTPFPRARECVSSSRPVSKPVFFFERARLRIAHATSSSATKKGSKALI